MTGKSWNNNDIEKLYQHNKDKSPADLDAFILSKAKESCNKDKPKLNKWLYALPSAAVLVLGMSFIIQIYKTPDAIHQESSLSVQEVSEPMEIELLEEVEEDSMKKTRARRIPASKPAPVPSTEMKVSAKKEKRQLERTQAVGQLKADIEAEALNSKTVMDDAYMEESLLSLQAPSLNTDFTPGTLSLDELIEQFNLQLEKHNYKEADDVLESIQKHHPDYDIGVLIERLEKATSENQN